MTTNITSHRSVPLLKQTHDSVIKAIVIVVDDFPLNLMVDKSVILFGMR